MHIGQPEQYYKRPPGHRQTLNRQQGDLQQHNRKAGGSTDWPAADYQTPAPSKEAASPDSG